MIERLSCIRKYLEVRLGDLLFFSFQSMYFSVQKPAHGRPLQAACESWIYRIGKRLSLATEKWDSLACALFLSPSAVFFFFVTFIRCILWLGSSLASSLTSCPPRTLSSSLY